MVLHQSGGDVILHHAGALSRGVGVAVVTLIPLSASADATASYAGSRARLAFTGANGGRQARSRSHVSGSLRQWRWGGESCTFLLDEALTKQKVMTCEVVLTVAAGQLPDRDTRRRSRGPLQRAPQSQTRQRDILLTCLFTGCSRRLWAESLVTAGYFLIHRRQRDGRI